jgi:transcriptional regulator GlxA family with amidase domain
MNMGIPQYVEFLRLSVACDLLKSTSKSVLEISEESGFGSVRSLNRAFSENLFTTPKDFRKHFAADYKIKLGGF